MKSEVFHGPKSPYAESRTYRDWQLMKRLADKAEAAIAELRPEPTVRDWRFVDEPLFLEDTWPTGPQNGA